MRGRCITIGILTLSSIVSQTHGDINFDFRATENDPWIPIGSVSSGSNATLSATAGFHRIWADDPLTEDLGLLTVNPDFPSSQIKILITTQNSGFTPGIPFLPGLKDWNGLSTSSLNLTLQATLTGSLLGDVGPVEIARIDAEGFISGNIIHDGGSLFPDLGAIRGFGMESIYRIESVDGDITEVQMTAFLDGSVIVSDPNAKIGLINVPTGEIGFLAGNLKAVIQSMNGIDSIVAQSIFADIIADFQNFDDTTVGPIGSITTSSGGDFQGLIQGTHISGGGIHIDGSVLGTIRLGTMFGTGSALPQDIFNPKFTIGNSLAAGGVIKLPTAGTAGNILINTNNVGGAWAGTVQVGPDTNPLLLTTPSYTNSSR